MSRPAYVSWTHPEDISPQARRIGGRIGKRDVAIRPYQVQRATLHSRVAHGVLPGEEMQWQREIGTRILKAGACIAVDMHLPCECSERREVVAVHHVDPGQTV